MGTKVHVKSHYPGYYSMRDLNEGCSGGSWSPYPENTPLKNGLFYTNCLPRPATDVYSEYDREGLRQMILKHESIFRNQVSELHRLYGTQMELMNEFKRKELGKYPMLVEASQSSPVSSQMQSGDTKKIWHIQSLPAVNSACSRASVSGTDNMQYASDFIKVSTVQAHLVPIENGSTLTDLELLEPRSRKVPRRMIDLQLPADEYIDCEDGEQIEKEKVSQPSVAESYHLKRNCGIVPESDLKLSLDNSAKPIFGGQPSTSNMIRNKHNLADLNKPIQVEETADSVAVNFISPVGCHREAQGYELPAKSNSGFLGLPKEFYRNSQRGENSGAHVNILRLEEGKGREWLTCKPDAGPSRSYLSSIPQGHAPSEYALDNHIKREPWSGCGIESSKRNQSFSNHTTSGHFATPGRQPSHSVIPQSDVTGSGTPVDSLWRTPLSSFNQKAIAVQALPCFDTSSQLRSKTPFPRPGLIAENGHHSCSSVSNSSVGNEASYQNGFSHWPLSESNMPQFCFPSMSYDCTKYNGDSASVSERNQCSTMDLKSSNCRDVKSLKGLNLNLTLPDVSQQKMDQQQDVVIIDVEGENEDPSKGIHWLRPSFSNGRTKEKGHSNKMGLSFLQTCSQNIEKNELPTPSLVQDSMSMSCSYDVEPEKPVVRVDPGNKRICGVSLFGKLLSVDSSTPGPPRSHDFPSDPDTIRDKGKVQLLDIDLSRDLATSDSSQPQLSKNEIVEKDMNKDISVVRNHFNLNLCVDEEEMPPETANRRATCEIDLEAPVGPETTEGISPGSQSPENQLEAPTHLPEDKDEELNRIAAEAIVFISSSRVYNPVEEATCPTSIASLWDSLNWFSGVISNMNDLDSKVELVSRGKNEDGHGESSDGIDYFESMTLKLTETKEDEFWCTKPWASDYQNEEEKTTSVLLTRRRRGQGRRGRQRRDFQRDILPGLVSLSRHEVTEDLQIIGGLMRATGCTWQTGSSRRNAARNGCARGRRRTQVPVSPVKPTVSPPKQQFNSIEVGLEDNSLKGWGKTTRRPRRQRYAASNPPIPITQA